MSVKVEKSRAQSAERDETGHECGHRFEITVRSSLHTSGVGEHRDADWWSDNDRPVTVRAHNLRDALLVAATLPLADWFEDEEEEHLRERSVRDGNGPVFLTRFGIPLRDAIDTDQPLLPLADDDGSCDSGWCFT